MKKMLCSLWLLLVVTGLVQAQTVVENWASVGNNIVALSCDASGNLYALDGNAATVIKIALDGTVTNPWASLPPGDYPRAMTIDETGNLYITTLTAVCLITSSGVVTPSWAAPSESPLAITVDNLSGNVYTSNYTNGVNPAYVSKITSGGVLTAHFSSYLTPSGQLPAGMLCDALGNLYIDNTRDPNIAKIAPDGTANNSWVLLDPGARPSGLVMDASGNLYTSNYGNSTISKIAPDGTVTKEWVDLPGAYPNSIAISATGNIYTANDDNNISQITPGGGLTEQWATLDPDYYYPYFLIIDRPRGILYMLNSAGGITKITTGDIVLPVSLIRFTGALNDGTADLQWQTGVEEGTRSFELEKSTNGNSFTKVAAIAPEGSNSSYTYSLPQADTVAYYRLHILDDNGSGTYSKTVQLRQAGEADASAVYPNPAHDYINIKVSAAGNAIIYDASNRPVKAASLQTGINYVDISNLVPGTYYVVMNDKKISFIRL